MAAIDAHTHAFPDEIAERAISSLEAAANWKAAGKGTACDLMASMDANGVDRVLFGTDWPWNDQGKELKRLRTLGLTREETGAVLFHNAARLLGY